MDHKKRACELRRCKERHYNCCQSTLLPFAEELGMDHETVCRLTTHFGGGMRRKAACGAVTGGLMALGLLGEVDEAQAVEFQNRFLARAGALDCGALLAAAAARGEERQAFCDGLVEQAVDLAEEMARERAR